MKVRLDRALGDHKFMELLKHFCNTCTTTGGVRSLCIGARDAQETTEHSEEETETGVQV